MKISGLIREYKRVRDSLRRGIPESERDEFARHVREVVDQVEEICSLYGESPDDLPGPSRNAYRFLAGLDLTDLPPPREGVEAPPPRVRVSGVVGAARAIRGELWRDRERLAADRAAREALKTEVAAHEAAIREVAREQGGSPASLPGQSRAAYAFLAWLAAGDHVERYLETLARIDGLFPRGPDRVLRVEITSTRSIYRYRRRGRLLTLGVSLAFVGAPREVLARLSAAVRGDDDALRDLRRYVRSDPGRRALAELDGPVRGPGGAVGRVRDLAASFARVNGEYFGGRLTPPNLEWSERPAGSRLGSYRRERDTVTISASLDDPAVEAFVLDYVLYHELLHRELGVEERDGRRRLHGPEFVARERRYRRREEAEAALRRLLGR